MKDEKTSLLENNIKQTDKEKDLNEPGKLIRVQQHHT